MADPTKKSKSDYNFTPVTIRGDRKFVNMVKSRAAQAGMPLSDYISECLIYANEQANPLFFMNAGNAADQNGKS